MNGFEHLLVESAVKNVHMEHIEDLVMNTGVNGTRQAINFLRSLRDMLQGNNKAKLNVSVKWDGAPAVFAGIDPSDGKFFVAKKGIFNKDPKVYKTNRDIDADTSGDLNAKLKVALKHLPALGIKNVVQGDLLFTDDLSSIEHEGEKFISFHPNTIVYAIPDDSMLAKQIKRSKIGIVWHTEYNGKSFEKMKAKANPRIAEKLGTSSNVFSISSAYQDVSGRVTFTAKETQKFNAKLTTLGKIFNASSAKVLNHFQTDEALLIRIKAYQNSRVKAGVKTPNPSKHVTALIAHLNDWYNSQIETKKSANGKATWTAKKKKDLAFFVKTPKKDIVRIFEMMNLIVELKDMIIKKMSEAGGTKTLLRTKQGYQVTGEEGFVAADHLGKNGVKLVDRLEFSKANFSPEFIKGWDSAAR